MELTKKLTLASQSKIRAAVLSGAGLTFDVRVSGVDEDAVKGANTGSAEALAQALARTRV